MSVVDVAFVLAVFIGIIESSTTSFTMFPMPLYEAMYFNATPHQESSLQ